MANEPAGHFTNAIRLLPNGREIFAAFLDIPISTFSIILGFLFWIGLMWIPLSGIDRRDETAGLTYALFMCFSGTLLIMAISQPPEAFSNVTTHLIVMMAAFAAAKLRWQNRSDVKNSFREISTDEVQK